MPAGKWTATGHARNPYPLAAAHALRQSAPRRHRRDDAQVHVARTPQRHGAAGPGHQGQRPARRRRRRRRQRLLPLPGSLQRPARALGHGAVGALAGPVFQSLVRGLPRSAGRGVAVLLSSSGLAVLGPGPGRAGHAGKRGGGRLLQPHLDDVVHGHVAEALLLLRRVVVEGDGPDLAAAAVGEAVAAVDPGVAAAAVAQGPLLDAVAVGGLGGGGQLGPRLAVPHHAVVQHGVGLAQVLQGQAERLLVD